MEITEKWLAEIGGWAAMKAARGLVEAGLVVVTSAEGGLIRGTTGSGKMKNSAGLRIRGSSDVDNLCTCPHARRTGSVCEHALAVVLCHVKGGPKPPTEAAPAAEKKPVLTQAAAVTPASMTIPGNYSVFLPEGLMQGVWRDPLGVFLRFEASEARETSRLVAWLAGQGITKPQTVPLSLRGAGALEFLAVLGEHPRVFAGKPNGTAQALQVMSVPTRLPLVIEADGTDVIRVEIAAKSQRHLAGNWWLSPETAVAFRVMSMTELESAMQVLQKGQSLRQPLRWLVEHRERLDEVFQVELRGEVLSGFHVVPVPCEFEITLEGSLQHVEARIVARYLTTTWPVLPHGAVSTVKAVSFPLQDADHPACFFTRDELAERRMAGRIEALGFRSDSRGGWALSGADAVMRFYASDLPRLRQYATILEGERWRTVTRGVQRIVPRTVVHEGCAAGGGGDWLRMDFSYEAADGFRIPRGEILRLIRSGQKSVQGKDGRKYILDAQAVEELEQTLQDVPLQLTPEGARVHPAHLSYFQGDSASEIPLPPEDEIRSALGPLAATLRQYQLDGVRWLSARATQGRGGILADDMGLGKTLQSIALVLIMAAQRRDKALPVLVICPKSLIGNWQAEFSRFAPSLKVQAISGAGRDKLMETMLDFDVIITSYPLIVRDLNHYQPIAFSLLLLDEASYIKNPDTAASKALRSLRAGARFALTGTPLENGVRDLWSIMHFALPGYLGNRENFKERFEQPITGSLETPAGQDAATRLRRLVRPYFLRRTKRQVLRELPEKIEQILWCDPSPAQQELYRRVLEEGREEIKSARRRSGQGGARMTMFTVLLRLRQVCCDLRLTGLPTEATKGLSQDDFSGKWSAIHERVTAILESGGKVLIFSQFVQFLRLLRDSLDELKIRYAYLDGSTQDRDAQVRQFQTQPDCPVFLISLKAGGYGLNLTAADHVILADPWWNPAVEAQAIDRAHRMGQQKIVNAYRIAVRGTVEERILALQSKKRGLIDATIEDDSPILSGLSEKELETILDD